MFQCLFAFFNEVVPLSIASIASFNVSLIHLPLVIRGLHLLIIFVFLLVLVQKMVGHFLCFGLVGLAIHFALYKTIDHHDLNPLGPNPRHVGGVLFNLTRSTNLNFLYFRSMTN
jgi:hypothetical protein